MSAEFLSDKVDIYAFFLLNLRKNLHSTLLLSSSVNYSRSASAFLPNFNLCAVSGIKKFGCLKHSYVNLPDIFSIPPENFHSSFFIDAKFVLVLSIVRALALTPYSAQKSIACRVVASIPSISTYPTGYF